MPKIMESIKICFICGSSHDLEMVFKEGYSKTLDMLGSFTHLSIEMYDHPSQYMCLKCIDDLREAFTFKMLYANTFAKFKRKRINRGCVQEMERKTTASSRYYSEVTLKNVQNSKDNQVRPTEQHNKRYKMPNEHKMQLAEIWTAPDEANVKNEQCGKEYNPRPVHASNECEIYVSDDSQNGDTNYSSVTYKQEDYSAKAVYTFLSSRGGIIKASRGKIQFKERIPIKNGWDEIYQCDKCGKVFSILSRLKIHEATHKTPDLYECDKCGKAFKDLRNFKLHMDLHSNPNLYQCNKCGKALSSARSLVKHKPTHWKPHIKKRM